MARGRWVACVLALTAGLLAPALALSAHISQGAKNLIANGGFERPPVGGGYQLFAVGQSFPGWQVVGTPGANVAPISGSFSQNGFAFKARAGRQWIDLTGTSDVIGKSGGGVKQTVKTLPGKRYRLRFSVGNVVDRGVFGVASAVVVSVNGHRLLFARNTEGNGVTTQVWKDYAVTFTATAATSAIQFTNADPVADTNDGLDAVSLTRVS